VVTAGAAFVAVMSLVIAIPINARNARIMQIEENLPDALKHMALVLKAGGTTESAVAEVSAAGYGPLSEELKVAFKKLREGKSFDDVFIETAKVTGSLLFQRTALIVVDARRAGAGVADVMFEIAEDARDVSRIKRERYSRTTMHVIFLVTSSLLLAPFIFGFAVSIVNYINQGIAGAMPQAPVRNLCDLNLLLVLFLIFQSIVTVVALGIIREGKAAKYILYAPLMVLGALVVYEIGKWLSFLIVGGKMLAC
jgi:pilus assembly protein TadC